MTCKLHNNFSVRFYVKLKKEETKALMTKITTTENQIVVVFRTLFLRYG